MYVPYVSILSVNIVCTRLSSLPFLPFSLLFYLHPSLISPILPLCDFPSPSLLE